MRWRIDEKEARLTRYSHSIGVRTLPVLYFFLTIPDSHRFRRPEMKPEYGCRRAAFWMCGSARSHLLAATKTYASDALAGTF